MIGVGFKKLASTPRPKLPTKTSPPDVFFFLLLFFSPQLILQKSDDIFQRKLSFLEVPGGGIYFNFFQCGGPIAYYLYKPI